MSLEQSMQVSTATLRAATTRHRHTDRVSGDTYHLIYLPSPTKGREVREQKHSTGTNGNQSQTARSHTAGKQNTKALQNPVQDPTKHDCLRVTTGQHWLDSNFLNMYLLNS